MEPCRYDDINYLRHPEFNQDNEYYECKDCCEQWVDFEPYCPSCSSHRTYEISEAELRDEWQNSIMFHDIKVLLEITIAAEADTEEEAQRHVDSMSNEELLTTILDQHSVPDLHTQTLQ